MLPRCSLRAGMQMLGVEHGLIRVRATGSGAHTVVFVADTPVFIEHYDTLIASLEPHYRVVCLELPGMGFSVPSATFGFSLVEQTEVVEQVLRALNVDVCTLAFACVHGYLALLLAQKAPSLVRRVALLQTPSWEEEQRWAKRIDFRGKGWVATPILGQLMVAASQRLIARRWFAKALSSSSDAAAFSRHSEAAFDAGCGWALASLVQAYFAAPAPVLAPISQPSLVIWGTEDRTHRATSSESVLQYFKDASCIYFDKAGHSPELEQPARFKEHLVRLIEH